LINDVDVIRNNSWVLFAKRSVSWDVFLLTALI